MIKLTYNDLGELYHIFTSLKFCNLFPSRMKILEFPAYASKKPYIILETVFVIDLNPFESVSNILKN